MPPSVNRGYRNRAIKTRERRDWEGHALWHLKAQRLPVVAGPAVLVMGFERPSLTADADNRIKYTQDILVSAGVIADDRFVVGGLYSWLPPASGLVHVAVVPCQHFGATFHPSPDGAAGAWTIAPPPHEE